MRRQCGRSVHPVRHGVITWRKSSREVALNKTSSHSRLHGTHLLASAREIAHYYSSYVGRRCIPSFVYGLRSNKRGTARNLSMKQDWSKKPGAVFHLRDPRVNLRSILTSAESTFSPSHIWVECSFSPSHVWVEDESDIDEDDDASSLGPVDGVLAAVPDVREGEHSQCYPPMD